MKDLTARDTTNRTQQNLLVQAAQLPQRSALQTPAIRGRMSASLIIPYARYGVRKLGHAGVIGLSVLIFSAAVFVSTNRQLHEQVAVQSRELVDSRAALERKLPEAGVGSQLGTVDGVVGQLPSRNDLPHIMGQIVAVATAAGLSLDRGSYGFTSTESEEISSYYLNLPVHGSYPQVREFIENTLATVPVASLDSMRVERNEVSSQVVAADLEFAVLIGNSK